MTILSDRRFLVLCVISAVVGVLSAIWLFPDRGLLVYVLPFVILAALMFADGYVASS